MKFLGRKVGNGLFIKLRISFSLGRQNLLLASLELIPIEGMLQFYSFARVCRLLFAGTLLLALFGRSFWMFFETLFVTLFDSHSVHVVRLDLLLNFIFFL
jgi:hypothetical protein